MIYFKTIFSSNEEYRFINCNLEENYNLIDKFVIIEANYTHTGQKREIIFNINNIPDVYHDKIIYLDIDLNGKAIDSINNEKMCHTINEKLIRGEFVNYLNLKKGDIVVSTDADEVLYNHVLPEAIKHCFQYGKTLLKLHQFYYKTNYYWYDNIFKAPNITLVSEDNFKTLDNWRDNGVLYKDFAGCHFSWCMPVEALLHKIKTYAHAPRYKHLAKKEIILKAIEEKKYPFDPNRSFNIKVLNYENKIYTESMRRNLNEN